MSFMSGRYGNDKLNNILICLYFTAWVINVFIPDNIASLILDIIQLTLILVIFGRMLSRNIYKRRKENDIFLRVFGRFIPDTKLLKSKIRDRHTHIYKKCPDCKSVLRLKKIPGNHTAVCPRCKNKFNVKVK